MKTHIVSTRKGEVDLYIHHCFKCNYMKYEYTNHTRSSWCSRCEKTTENHLLKGRNFKTEEAFLRHNKIKDILS